MIIIKLIKFSIYLYLLKLINQYDLNIQNNFEKIYGTWLQDSYMSESLKRILLRMDCILTEDFTSECTKI